MGKHEDKTTCVTLRRSRSSLPRESAARPLGPWVDKPLLGRARGERDGLGGTGRRRLSCDADNDEEGVGAAGLLWKGVLQTCHRARWDPSSAVGPSQSEWEIKEGAEDALGDCCVGGKARLGGVLWG